MLKPDQVKSILIIGITGGLAHIIAEMLSKKYPEAQITGVDSRETSHPVIRKNVHYTQMKYTRGNFEKLFRDKQFDVVLHLGRISHVRTTPGSANFNRRLNLNLMGTTTILELALKFKVKKMIILSTHHVYGALADNPIFIKEDAPLRASFKYPELRDVVEMDQLCTNWMWKNQQQLSTVVLRPCNIIGPQIKNTITQYLCSPYVPVPIDFNPMYQFIHEFDMSNVIVQAIEKVPTGIYNVANDDVISIREAKKIINAKRIDMPIILLEQLARFIRPLWSFPSYLLDYLKYPAVIDNSEIKKYISSDSFRFPAREALNLLKLH